MKGLTSNRKNPAAEWFRVGELSSAERLDTVYPIEPPFNVQMMGFSQLENTNISLRVPLIRPTGRWPLVVFLRQCHLRYKDFSHSETRIANLIMGPTPTQSRRMVTLSLQVPTKFTVPLMGFPHSEATVNLTPLMGPTPTQKHIQSINGSHPHFRIFQVCKYHWWDYPHSDTTP